jgi:hypothetical protein
MYDINMMNNMAAKVMNRSNLTVSNPSCIFQDKEMRYWKTTPTAMVRVTIPTKDR